MKNRNGVRCVLFRCMSLEYSTTFYCGGEEKEGKDIVVGMSDLWVGEVGGVG